MATEETTAVATQTSTALPALSDEMMGYLGYSEKQEDSLIPVLSILQDNSGEVKKKHERYIDGAEAGMFIIRALQKVFPAEKPIVFQPCGFTHEWVEWTGEPGEGGAPVASYPYESRPVAASEVEDGQGRKVWRMPETNNRLVETRHHFGNIVTDDGDVVPVVMPMSGTNHSISRQWTAMMKNFMVPGTAKRAPGFTRLYEITTSFVQKGQQSWYKYKVKDAGWVTDQNLLKMGFEFAKAVAEGAVRAGSDAEDSAVAAPADDDSVPI
jgi:hypothetical protein